jgi:hypothetical protein
MTGGAASAFPDAPALRSVRSLSTSPRVGGSFRLDHAQGGQRHRVAAPRSAM